MTGYVMDGLSKKRTIYVVDDEAVFMEGFKLNMSAPTKETREKVKAYLRKLATSNFKTTTTLPATGLGIAFEE